jgi:hypothetical protein
VNPEYSRVNNFVADAHRNDHFSKDKTGAREPRVPANGTVLEN